MPIEPACVSAAALPNCTGTPNMDHTRTCEGRTWWWWARSDLACHLTAKALNLESCCYGWSDLVWLPAHSQPAFRRLASGGRDLLNLRQWDRRGRLIDLGLVGKYSRDDFREVMHEVAMKSATAVVPSTVAPIHANTISVTV